MIPEECPGLTGEEESEDEGIREQRRKPSNQGGHLDRFLSQQQSDGALDSDGSFTIDSALARRKQSFFQLAQPGAYVLKFVQAAVSAGASTLVVTVKRDQLALSISSVHPDFSQLEQLANALFQLPSERGPLRHLAVGLNAASHETPLEVLWQTPRGTLAIGQDNVRVLEASETTPRLVVKKPRRLFQWFRGNFFVDEIAHLPRACQYAPLDITLDGRPLERPLLSRTTGPVLDNLGLSHSHHLFELVLPSGSGPRAHYPVGLYERLESGLQLWVGKAFSQTPIPLVVDGWDGTSRALSAGAVVCVPPCGRGSSEVLPVLDGVCLAPLRRNDFGFSGLRILLDATDLNADLSEFALIQDDELSFKLDWVRERLTEALGRVNQSVLRQAFLRAGVEEDRVEALLESILPSLEYHPPQIGPTVEDVVASIFANSQVRLGPDISEKQLANSRKIYARCLPEAERILALYDDTVFGNGKEGFVITEHRVCWNAAFSGGSYLLWSELPYCKAAKLMPTGVEVGGALVSVFSLHAEVTSLFFDLLQTIAQLELAPLHTHPPCEWRVFSRALATLGRRNRVSYHPYHSRTWLAKLPSLYMGHWVEGEHALIAFDDTLMGGATNGFVATKNRLLWRNAFSDPDSLLWREMSADQIEVSSRGVQIGGRKIQIHLKELVQPVEDFLKRMTYL